MNVTLPDAGDKGMHYRKDSLVAGHDDGGAGLGPHRFACTQQPRSLCLSEGYPDAIAADHPQIGHRQTPALGRSAA